MRSDQYLYTLSCIHTYTYIRAHLTAWAVHLFLKNLVTLTTKTKEASATNRLTRESIVEACELNKSYGFLKSEIDTHFSAPTKRASSTIITTSSLGLPKTKKKVVDSLLLKDETNINLADEPETTENTVFDGESRTFDDASVFII